MNKNKFKRKGGAARLRDLNNKKLKKTASKCYSIDQMFSKKNVKPSLMVSVN